MFTSFKLLFRRDLYKKISNKLELELIQDTQILLFWCLSVAMCIFSKLGLGRWRIEAYLS